MEHVNNAYAANNLRAGEPTKDDSHWVSTGGYGLIKRIDPTFAQQVLNTNLYKIVTARALATGNFYDVNDAFDRAGVNRPYATQREWIKHGGILNTAITLYMDGRTYAGQLNDSGVAPDEDALVGWQQF